MTDAVIGERWAVGEVVLQVSCPRIPCVTFAVWLREERWLPRFTRARVPGAYLRVLTPGTLAAGAEVAVLDVPAHGVTAATAFAAFTTEPGLLPLLREVPELPREDSRAVERRLGDASPRRAR